MRSSGRERVNKHVRIDQRVPATKAVEVPVFFTLCSNRNHVTDVEGS
jgi:hypothetical protein